MYDSVLSVAFGRTGFEAYLLTVELYSGFSGVSSIISGSGSASTFSFAGFFFAGAFFLAFLFCHRNPGYAFR